MASHLTDIEKQLEQCWEDMVAKPEATLATLRAIVSQLPKKHEQRSKALFYLGCCLVFNGDYTAAVAELRTALAIAKRKKDSHQIRRVQNSLGMAYKSLGDYAKAISALDDAISLADQLDYMEGRIIAQLNLVELYYDVGDLEAFEQTLNNVLNSGFASTDLEVIGSVRMFEGRLAMMHYDFPASERALRDALNAAHEINFAHLRINTLIELGRLQRLQGQIELSVSTLQTAVVDHDLSLEGVAGLVAHVELAKALLMIGDYDQSYEILTDAIGILVAHGEDHSKIRFQVYELMASCLTKTNRFEEAYNYLQQAFELKNSFSNIQLKRTLEIRKQEQQKEYDRIARENTQRENDLLKRSQQQLSTINQVAIELAATLEMDTLGAKLYDLMRRYFDAHFIGLSVNDPVNQTITFRVLLEDGDLMPLYCLPHSVSDSLTVQTVLKKETMSLSAENLPIRSGKTQNIPRSQLFLPLIQDANVLGVLSIQSVMLNRFEGDDLQLILAFAPFITLALSNALSHEQVHLLNQELHFEKRQIEQAQKRIEFLANHDTLTELPNRRALEEHIGFKLATVHKQVFSLVYIDLDGFKPINDEHGHIIGDQVLQVVSDRMQNVLRKSDFAARIGGDEFVLVVESVIDRQKIDHLINRVLKSIEKPISIHGTMMQVSASIGVVQCNDQTNTLDELMHFADQAMYDVKRSGKGGIKFYSK